MRKVSIGLLLAGFVFLFVDIPFMGIDILLDAVGYIFIFNAARGLAALQPAFKPAIPCSIAMALASAFFTIAAGVPALAPVAQAGGGALPSLVLSVGDILLLLFLARGFSRLATGSASRAAAIFTTIAFAANILLLGAVLAFAGAALVAGLLGYALAVASTVGGLAVWLPHLVHLLLGAGLLWQLLLPDAPAPPLPEPPPNEQ